MAGISPWNFANWGQSPNYRLSVQLLNGFQLTNILSPLSIASCRVPYHSYELSDTGLRWATRGLDYLFMYLLESGSVSKTVYDLVVKLSL